MSLLFSLLMKMDAGQAKAELRALQGELSKGKAEVAGLGAAAAAADGKVDGLAAASGRAAAQNDKLSQSHVRVGQSAGAASANTSNLVANFNDTFMMIASGQAPMMTAIQQGTQITQVLGPMGAAGAARSVGTALVAMVSPFNMATLAAIAFGSAAIQWLFSSEDAALSLTDALEGSAAAIDELKKVGQVDLASLRKDFGAVTSDVVEMQKALTKLASVKAIQAQQAAVAALKAETAGSWWAAFTDQRFTQGGQIADILGTDWLVRGKLVATKEVASFRKTLESLETARGPRAQLEIFESLQAQMIAATGGIDQMTLSQMGFYEGLVLSEQQIRQNIQAQREALLAAQEQQRAAGGKDDGRMGAPLAIDLTGEAESGQISADLAMAKELLATLGQEAAVRDLITEKTDTARIATVDRTLAEREAFLAMAEGLDITENLRLQLVAAWDAAKGLASSAPTPGWMSAAVGETNLLIGRLIVASAEKARLLSIASSYNYDQLKSNTGQSSGPDAVRTEINGGGLFTPRVTGAGLATPITLGRGGVGGTGRRGGSGGGAAAAREEKDAVAELIAKLREEQQTMQETDPVKREMLKYRKQLAEASKTEVAEVEGLIQAEMRLKAVQAAREYASDAVGDFLDQVIAKGGKASDVLRGLAAQFFAMAAKSAVTGQGWFAQALGIAGGLFGGKTAAAMPAASKAAAYQPVQSPTAAFGAAASQASSAAANSSKAQSPVISVVINGATGNSEIRQMVDQGVQMGLKQYNDQVLPDRVAQISRAPRNR